MAATLAPDPLASLMPVLSTMSLSDLQWIARAHLDYLDGKFYDIRRLTNYLATCRHVERERLEYIRFVDFALFREGTDINEYTAAFALRYKETRAIVLSQCDEILRGEFWESDASRLDFWRRFALENELDSLHGMFLTSGRWYTNAMLPAIKSLATAFLETIPRRQPASSDELAVGLSLATITPEYQLKHIEPERSLVNEFARPVMAALRSVDHEVLSLFYDLHSVPFRRDWSLEDLVREVHRDPEGYSELLGNGIYPPFAWHELHATRPKSDRATSPKVSPDLSNHPGWVAGLEALRVFKRFEADYNNFNYKGFFCIISRFMYLATLKYLPEPSRTDFLDAILGDRFFDALAVLESEWAG